MHRLTSLIMAAVFILWILPLGVFIAPSKEKAFCGGQRAICLCSHMAAKHKQPASAKIVTVSPVEKEAPGFSPSMYDAAIAARDAAADKTSFYSSRHNHLYNLLVCRPVEHVPKV